MRVLLALIGLAAIVLVVGMSLGLIRITQTRDGTLPTVAVKGGQAPAFAAETANVSLGTENKTVRVPTISIKEEQVKVPTLKVEKPANAAAPAPN